MGDLTAKFGTFEGQVSAQHDEVMSALDTLNTNLGGVGEAITTLNNSMQAAIRSIQLTAGANDPCACAANPTVRVPPTGTTFLGISEDQCKRIQAFLHTMQEIMTVADFASAFNVGLNFSLIYNSINEVIASIESGSDLPVISYSEGVRVVGDMINYVASNIFRGDTMSGAFASILLGLRDGMSLSTDATSAQSAYNGVVDASDLPDDEKALVKDLAYTALYNFYFDPGTTPDLTGYDGSLCVPDLTTITECITFPSEDWVSGGHTFSVWATPRTAADGISIAGNFNGFSVHILETVGEHATAVYYSTVSGTYIFIAQATHDAAPIPIIHDTISIFVRGVDFDGDRTDWTAELCPPA